MMFAKKVPSGRNMTAMSWFSLIFLVLPQITATYGDYPQHFLDNDEYVVRNPFHDFYQGRLSMEEMISEDYMCHHSLFIQLSHLKKGVRCGHAGFEKQLGRVTDKCCRSEHRIGCRFRDIVVLGCRTEQCEQRCKMVPQLIREEIEDILSGAPDGLDKKVIVNITDYLDALSEVLPNNSTMKERNIMLLQHPSIGDWHPHLVKNLVRDIVGLPDNERTQLLTNVFEKASLDE